MLFSNHLLSLRSHIEMEHRAALISRQRPRESEETKRRESEETLTTHRVLTALNPTLHIATTALKLHATLLPGHSTCHVYQTIPEKLSRALLSTRAQHQTLAHVLTTTTPCRASATTTPGTRTDTMRLDTTIKI